MPFDPNMLPETVKVIEGDIYDDGWISPHLALSLGPRDRDGVLQLVLWNPDFSVHLDENAVTVQSEKMTKRSSNIGLNQVFEIQVSLTEGDTSETSLKTMKYLAAQDYDPRERALKLVSVQWVDQLDL